ncbi:immune-associated nucleotide-binding protein 9 [Tanacetum coccineum]
MVLHSLFWLDTEVRELSNYGKKLVSGITNLYTKQLSRVVEQISSENWKEIDNESEDRKVERDAEREGEPNIIATFGSNRGITIWDPGNSFFRHHLEDKVVSKEQGVMGGCSFEDDCELISPRTLVLVGKTGNGKSATGNSILGMKSFNSKRSSSGVTITSELQATSLDGQMLNVIDTPGLFDSTLDFDFIGKEIVNCINMAKDGIHAFLVVVSIRSRFSEDEKAAVSSLLTLFGRKIYDYMIVVFTGGDELDDDGESLEDFLRDSPKALKARAIEKKVRKMEFGTRFGMAPEFSGVVSHSREALARTMECREALAPTTEWCAILFSRAKAWRQPMAPPFPPLLQEKVSL